MAFALGMAAGPPGWLTLAVGSVVTAGVALAWNQGFGSDFQKAMAENYNPGNVYVSKVLQWGSIINDEYSVYLPVVVGKLFLEYRQEETTDAAAWYRVDKTLATYVYVKNGSATSPEITINGVRPDWRPEDQAAQIDRLFGEINSFDPKGELALDPDAAKQGWNPTARCFTGDTAILMADGSEKCIRHVEVGDWVLAFQPGNAVAVHGLKPARVTNVFRNGQERVYRIAGSECGTTAGHSFFDGDDGQERPLWQIIERGGSLIDRDGRRHRAKMRDFGNCSEGGRARAFEAGAVLPEQRPSPADSDLATLDRTEALSLPIVWVEDRGEVEAVYNFEVEGLHTYVAGGWRVHNDSFLARELGSSLGSFIGSTLLDVWGVDNIGARLAVGAVTSSLGAWIGDTLYHGLNDQPISSPVAFFNNFGGSLIASAVNLGGAALGRALLGAIGLQNDPIASNLTSIFGGDVGAAWRRRDRASDRARHRLELPGGQSAVRRQVGQWHDHRRLRRRRGAQVQPGRRRRQLIGGHWQRGCGVHRQLRGVEACVGAVQRGEPAVGGAGLVDRRHDRVDRRQPAGGVAGFIGSALGIQEVGMVTRASASPGR